MHGTDSGQMDRLAVNAIADIEDFWQEAYPRTFWAKFPTTPATASTRTVSAGTGARYCPNSCGCSGPWLSR
ncbi:lipoprotein peptidase LpqM [Mycobacteroides abscessus subsp. abscessus]|nr:lipoprotein peptidase LpqM [Mycobacteroides abscessus subsp. abscessus]